jgi:hypothetical protein
MDHPGSATTHTRGAGTVNDLKEFMIFVEIPASEEFHATGLPVFLKPGQRVLLHRVPPCEARSCIRMAGNSEFP